MHWALLWSDQLILVLFFLLAIIFFLCLRQTHFRLRCRHILANRLAIVSIVILLPYLMIGLLDSLHLNWSIAPQDTRFVSVLDLLIAPLWKNQEVTYSAPFSLYSFNRRLLIKPNGIREMAYVRLQHAGQHIQNNAERNRDIIKRILRGLFWGSLTYSIFIGASSLLRWLAKRFFFKKTSRRYTSSIAGYSGLLALLVVWLVVAVMSQLIFAYHVLGTSKVGNDILYETIKSIRTGLLIGTLTTLFALPFALLLGIAAGYFRGWVDDIIQYFYTTLSSIPGVLLISAMVLVLEVYINQHADLFPTLEQRADMRLLVLCLILGITSWSGLCRLLRAETLKIRQFEFVQAARAFGVSHWMIIFRHIMPNLLHIVIINLVLDFSGLVLAEAVLSYIGVGVDPTTMSWGNMINSSRLELAREPAVWWPLLSALTFMFILVLSINVLADVIRDAFDPRVIDYLSDEHKV